MMKEIDNYDDSEELNGPDSSGRNWKGIGIALLVIAVICALVILAILLGAPATHEQHYREGIPLTLHDVTDGSLNPSYKAWQWLSGHELLYQSETNQSIIIHDLSKNTTALFLDLRISGKYSVSPSRKYVFFTENTEKVYRHTRKAFYKVIDLEKSTLLNNSWTILPVGKTNVKLQYATWAASSGLDKLIFVYENDIYYKRSPTAESVRLTDTGSTDEKAVVVYNGIPDWLYEEEILSSDHAVWWSPTGQFLAYLSFNDTMVETFSFDTYGGDSISQQYANSTKIRYPKAGTRNPDVGLYIIDPEEVSRSQVVPGASARVNPPPEVNFKEFYITRVSWLSPDKLFVRWTNRVQNTSILTTCAPLTRTCQKITTLTSPGGWLEDSPPFSLENGAKLIMIAADHPVNDEAQHQTICTISTEMGPVPSTLQCIKLDFDVTEILAVKRDSNENVVYALAAYQAPRYRHIMKIVGSSITCLTCNLVLPRNCTYYGGVKFSENKEYLVLSCGGPSVPYMQIWSVANLTAGGSALYDLKSNAKLQTTIDGKGIPQRRHFEVPLSSLPNGPKAQVELMLPPKMAEYASKRYPLLIKVYAGPGTQEVNTLYRMEIEELFASAHEIVVAKIDARGSAFQGNTFKHLVNRNLGFFEIKDQLEVARHILEANPFLDPNRVGIWGWSYGGYAAARAVLLDNVPQVIKCAASVAPVTDWRFYDTAYTERFMGTPEDNLKAYENSNLMPYNHDDLYWHFSRTSYLLVHGTGDDNVHFQQAAQFTKALMKADVIFKTQIYPDEDHGIVKLRLHLYHTLLQHFLTCFGSESIHEKGDD